MYFFDYPMRDGGEWRSYFFLLEYSVEIMNKIKINGAHCTTIAPNQMENKNSSNNFTIQL